MRKLVVKQDAQTLLAANVLRLRTKMGVSQEKLAELAGFHRTYVSQVERCATNASTANIQKLADALNVPVVDLFRAGSES